MKKVAIVIHGGAGEDNDFIRQNLEAYQQGLQESVEHGHELLLKGGSALDAVTAAVKILEDNPLFNAGRGAALNEKGEVEMDAAIMDGNAKKAGAVSLVCGVKNPIELARIVMEQTQHVHIGGPGACEVAKANNLEMKPDAWFITDHQREALEKEQKSGKKKKHHGTVGAVAIDQDGNLAAATSTGGLVNSLSGRVGDSCIIGAGCYANNEICAVSCTGHGELIITGVIAYHIAMLIQLKNMPLQQACEEVMSTIGPDGDLGIVSVDSSGNLGICMNCERMHRASIDTSGKLDIQVYKN